MMKSMTGYGSAEGKVGNGRIFIEIKSINHRYYDFQLKIPPKMGPLDPLFRELVKDIVQRGKIELYLKERKEIVPTKDITVDIELAKKYYKCLQNLSRELGLPKKNIHPLEVIDFKDLVRVEDTAVDYAKHWNSIKAATLTALKNLDRMRSKEGEFILKDQTDRLKKIGLLVDRLSKQSKESLKKREAKILERMPAENNSKNEAAYIAEKMDVTEELIRLKSHVNQYSGILKQKNAVGRQLDFLLQEMNREINTLGAKSGDAMISKYVVEVKSELEKLREQVQNVE